MVISACIFWGLDNNLTREVVELSSTSLACIKGLVAGFFNILLALVFFSGYGTGLQMAGIMAIGALSYGLSLVLFVEALRKIGSARTVTFFSIGPFVGTLLSVVMLGESPPTQYWFAAALMIAGILLLCSEKHGHMHTHEAVTHRHSHLQDEHHSHPHDDNQSSGPHDHLHSHESLTHIHGHWPDIHHRHVH